MAVLGSQNHVFGDYFFFKNQAVIQNNLFRLKFINFMQYGDTEFLLGPNLNVIIGPNGSGKSTIGTYFFPLYLPTYFYSFHNRKNWFTQTELLVN